MCINWHQLKPGVQLALDSALLNLKNNFKCVLWPCSLMDHLTNAFHLQTLNLKWPLMAVCEVDIKEYLFLMGV